MNKDQYTKRFFELEYTKGRPVLIGLKEDALRKFIAPFYLRRKISDIIPSLRGENEFFQVELEDPEKAIYQKAVNDRGVILSGGKVQDINRTLSKLKIKALVKYVKGVLKENPGRKIVIVSQFPEILDLIRESLPMTVAFPNNGQIVFIDAGEFREGQNLTEYDLVLILDVYANKLNNLQLKRRFFRRGQKNLVRCVYFLAGLLDYELLKMPEFSSHTKVTEHIAKYFIKTMPSKEKLAA